MPRSHRRPWRHVVWEYDGVRWRVGISRHVLTSVGVALALLAVGCSSGAGGGSTPPIAADPTSRFVLPPEESTGVGFRIGTNEVSAEVSPTHVTMYTIAFDGPDGQPLVIQAFKNLSWFRLNDGAQDTLPAPTGETAADLGVPTAWPQTTVSTQTFGTVVVTCMNGENVMARPGTPAHLDTPFDPPGAVGFVDADWTFSLSPPTQLSTPMPTPCQITPVDIEALTTAVDQLRIVDQQTWQNFVNDHRDTNTMSPTTGNAN